MIFKHNQEKNIKKLPQILLNDEFDNYARTLGKNYNNIENLLASRSLAEFRTTTNSQETTNHTHNQNNHNTTSSTFKSSHNSNSSHTSVDSSSQTMKSKAVREKSFYFDDIDQQTPVTQNPNTSELEVKNITKDTGSY